MLSFFAVCFRRANPSVRARQLTFFDFSQMLDENVYSCYNIEKINFSRLYL